MTCDLFSKNGLTSSNQNEHRVYDTTKCLSNQNLSVMKKFLSSFFGDRSAKTEMKPVSNHNLLNEAELTTDGVTARTIENFNKLGYQAAQITQGCLERMRSDLDSIRLQLMVNAEQLRSRLLYREQVEAKQAEIEKHTNETAQIHQDIENTKGRIEEIRTELQDTKTEGAMRDEQSSFKPLVYWTSIAALTLIGLYLIVFYMSALNSALFKELDLNGLSEVEVLMNSIFDTTVLSTWLAQTPFLILGAFLFMGFGAVPHLLKVRENFQKMHPVTKGLTVIGSYLACFLVDGLIAYKIDQNIHETSYSLGLAESLDFNVWSSPNFYIVLALGFGAYVVWGFFYDQLIDEQSKKNPKKVLVLKARQLRDRLNELNEELRQLQSNLAKNAAVLKGLENELTRLKDSADKVSYNVRAIQRNCNEYFSGFVTYIAANAEYLDINATEAEKALNQFKAAHFNEAPVLQKVA